ncbi:MAG: YcxB family protein, partial [Actinomycetota bacterium]
MSRLADEAIEYENSMEDWIQFRIFHLKHSHSGRTKRNRNALVAALAGFAVFSALAAIGGDWTPVTMLPAALFAAVAAALSWPLTLLGVRKKAARLYTEGKEPTKLGWHKLTLTEDALREENAAGSISHSFDSIERVRVTEDYVYIYTGATSAHVIPTDKVLYGD